MAILHIRKPLPAIKDVVANLSSGYDVRMGGIASYLLGDPEYDDTLCKVGQLQ